MGRRTALVRGRGGDGRTLLLGGDAVAGGRRAAPHLRAIAPIAIGSNYFDGWVYQGGAFQLGFNLFWVQIMAGRGKRARVEEQYSHLPLASAPLAQTARAGASTASGSNTPCSTTTGAHCRSTAATARCCVPVFNVGGWYDIFLGGTLENFCGCAAKGAASPPGRAPGCWSGRGPTAAPTAPTRTTPSRRSRRRTDIDMLAAQLEFLGERCSNGSP